MDRVTDLLEHTQHLLDQNGNISSNAMQLNIFTLLREIHDEVNLHSVFLAELLNPFGTHNCGTMFLERFLELVGIPLEAQEVRTVQQEFHHMDIFISTDSDCIIIENKIYAGEQPKQVQRYYNFAKTQGYSTVYVVYLTLFGDSPTAQSQGTIDSQFICPISYAVDIISWVAHCLPQVQTRLRIRETLIQYQQVVAQLTGQYYGENLMDIMTQLSDVKTFEAAVAVQQALLQKKIDTQHKFWQELELYLKSTGFSVKHSFYTYNRNKIANFYRPNKRTLSYGILSNIEHPRIQSKVGLYITVEDQFYYGFVGLENGERVKIMGKSAFDPFRKILDQMEMERDESTWYLGHHLPKMPLEFMQFSNPQTMQLINEQERRKYITKLVDEIQETIDEFLTKAA